MGFQPLEARYAVAASADVCQRGRNDRSFRLAALRGPGRNAAVDQGSVVGGLVLGGAEEGVVTKGGGHGSDGVGGRANKADGSSDHGASANRNRSIGARGGHDVDVPRQVSSAD